MKGTLAISLDVAGDRRSNRKPQKPRAPRLVPAEYGLQLKGLAKQHGIGWEALADDALISTVSAWRVTKGTGSVQHAEALRSALVKRLDAKRVPGGVPPLVLRPPPGLEEWVDLGHRMLVASSEKFAQTVDRMRTLVESMETVEAGIASISYPLPTDDE